MRVGASKRAIVEFTDIAKARTARGLRLALTRGIPGPWSQSARKIFDLKRVPYLAVAQYTREANQELQEWTGVRNAPVAVYEDERPLTGWAEILMLAERLEPLPALLPVDSSQRALAFGIANEICGEWGFGWTRRVMMVATLGEDLSSDPVNSSKAAAYRLTAEAALAAPQRAAHVMQMLAHRLRTQEDVGSPFLVGDRLTACDIYWACFSVLLDPPAWAPLPDALRALYGTTHPSLDSARDPILLRHRDYVFDTEIGAFLDC
jgi:glutathione S-transferase